MKALVLPKLGGWQDLVVADVPAPEIRRPNEVRVLVHTAGINHLDLFILPGYQFQVADALVTNFHLPKSTLLMLVSALAGVDVIRRAYAHAVAARYRFFSYGDAMFLTRDSA